MAQILGWLRRGTGTGLAQETLASQRSNKVFGKYLDGDIPAQAGVLAPINLTHAAGANRRKDFVRAEFVADRKGHEAQLSLIDQEECGNGSRNSDSDRTPENAPAWPPCRIPPMNAVPSSLHVPDMAYAYRDLPRNRPGSSLK